LWGSLLVCLTHPVRARAHGVRHTDTSDQQCTLKTKPRCHARARKHACSTRLYESLPRHALPLLQQQPSSSSLSNPATSSTVGSGEMHRFPLGSTAITLALNALRASERPLERRPTSCRSRVQRAAQSEVPTFLRRSWISLEQKLSRGKVYVFLCATIWWA
jgi:hypothetical protein